MNKNVEKFYSLLMENPMEINKIQEELRKVQDEKDLMDFIDTKVIPLAKEKGLEFTKEDLISYESESLNKLSEEDLLNVGGGISTQNKKIVSLLFAGISLSNNLQNGTYAMKSNIAASKSNQNKTNDQTTNYGQDNQTKELVISKDDEVTNLTEFEAPAGIKKLIIGNDAFRGKTLEKFKIPDSVEELDIRDHAFSGTSLREFEVPASVKKLTIGRGAFVDEESFIDDEAYGIDRTNSIDSSIDETIEFVTLETVEKDPFVDIKLLDGLEELNIEDYAFSGASLNEFEIPASVKRLNIGKSAFENSSLKAFKIPDSVKEVSIGRCAFLGCSDLTEVIIPRSITEISDSAFSNCDSLREIIIPNSVIKIGRFAFYQCRNLTQISIPDSVTEIDSFAFCECESLEQIKIPANVNKINGYAFSSCRKLKQITIPNSVTKIDNGTFSSCKSLKQVNIPTSVTEIGHSAFNGCESLTQIEIPISVTKIGTHAFWRCKNLKQIKIPTSVTEISNFTFCGCQSLEQIIIPTSVIRIGERAFDGCESLNEVEIPTNVVEIGKEAFSNCERLAIVSFTELIDDSVQNENLPDLIIGEMAFARSGVQQVGIPYRAVNIGPRAFEKCLDLGIVVLVGNDTDAKITMIGEEAFADCEKLKYVTSEKNIGFLSIGRRTFAGCIDLNSFSINDGKEVNFGEGAFSGCTELYNVKFPWKGELFNNQLLYNAFKDTPYCDMIIKR